MILRALTLCLLLGWVGLCFGENDGQMHLLTYGRGESLLILGSEDDRDGYFFSYGYGRNEPRFKWKSIPGKLVYEGYYSRTHGGGVSGAPRDATDAYGVLAYASYEKAFSANFGGYFNIGLGLQIADDTSVDLDSRINSTPMIGAGFSIRAGRQDVLLGLRLLHVSNAGTRGDNQGQNQLFLTASLRF